MTRQLIRSVAFLAALPFAAASAQEARVFTFEPGRVEFVRTTMVNRPMLGVTLNEGSERADTLGLRVQDVTEDSPAGKAGIKAGDRLQSINGVSLRADRGDAGQSDYDGVLLRRLQREMAKVEENDTVSLQVLSDGRSRDLRVVAVSPEELHGSPRAGTLRRVSNDRAVLGITTSTSAMGNARDTLGVFVSSVNDSGPAAKAGLVEGDRIAAINGINLRVAREDAGDVQVAEGRASRLRTELEKLTAGASVELTVITAGRSRTIRVTTVTASDLQSRYDATSGALEEAMFRLRHSMPVHPTPPAVPSAPKVPLAPAAPEAPRVRTILRDVRVL